MILTPRCRMGGWMSSKRVVSLPLISELTCQPPPPDRAFLSLSLLTIMVQLTPRAVMRLSHSHDSALSDFAPCLQVIMLKETPSEQPGQLTRYRSGLLPPDSSSCSLQGLTLVGSFRSVECCSLTEAT